jgi:hypothetical protein
MSHVTRFPIRFTGLNRSMFLLGMTRSKSYVDVDPSTIVVRMAWAFRAIVPRSSVRSFTDDHEAVWGWGVHGWRGMWLVNGSSSGIVRIEIDPPERARVMGVPVRLRVLRVALEDPEGFQQVMRADS